MPASQQECLQKESETLREPLTCTFTRRSRSAIVVVTGRVHESGDEVGGRNGSAVLAVLGAQPVPA
jgi:hypothetical protein